VLFRSTAAAREEGVAPDERAPASPEALVGLFVDHLRLAGRAEGTLEYYRRHLGELVRALHPLPLARWSPADLRRHLTARAWSPRRVGMVLGAARAWGRWAREAGYAVPDFTAGIPRPKVRQVRREALSPDQVLALLAACRGRKVDVAVHLAACAGLSRGDVRTLTWDRVDLAGGWIRTARRKTGEPVDVPIVEPLATVLRERRGLRGLVCRDLPRTDSCLHAMLRRACREAGVPSVGLHALRHAYATMMQRAGVDVATIGRLLAHRHGSAVSLIYLHPDEGSLRAAAGKVERALGGGAR
jgi:integrase